MVSSSNKSLPHFPKVLWEIRFIKVPDFSPDIHKPAVFLNLPSDLLKGNEEYLLKLMSLFHSASKKLMEDLTKEITDLQHITTENEMDKNVEIAKMLAWIKMIQELIERLKKEIS